MATDIDRIDALLADQEATIQAAFREFIRSMNSPEVTKEILGMLEAGDVNGALAIVDSYAVRFSNVLPIVHAAVGLAEAKALADIAGSFAVAVTFDPHHERAAQLVRAQRMQWIQQFTENQRESTREALAEAFRSGAGTEETARAFRSSIGLTNYQRKIVENFETQLRTLDRRALARELRDHRSDTVLERALDLKKPLTEKQINSQVERYRARWLAKRAADIARTEALTATSQARREAVQQMAEQTGRNSTDVRRKWRRTKDERTRDWHDSMEGQERGFDEPYEDGKGQAVMYPGDPDAPANTRINCRCSEEYEFKPAGSR